MKPLKSSESPDSKFASLAELQNTLGFYTSQNQNLLNESTTSWNTDGKLTYDGRKPPINQMVPPTPFKKTDDEPGQNWSSWKGSDVGLYSASQTADGKYPLWKIKSQREPYAVQHLNNEYGTLNTRLGTNL